MKRGGRDRFCAGVAVTDITPPAGIDLSGGAFGPAKSVLHPANFKAERGAHERKSYEAVHLPRYLGICAFAPGVVEQVTAACGEPLRRLDARRGGRGRNGG